MAAQASLFESSKGLVSQVLRFCALLKPWLGLIDGSRDGGRAILNLETSVVADKLDYDTCLRQHGS